MWHRNKEGRGVRKGVLCLQVAERADILLLSVKPYQYEAVIAEIRDAVRSG